MINFRLKTTNVTAEGLRELHNSTGVTPNVLSRIAIALSLRVSSQPEFVQGESKGIEFNRHTLTGDLDILYKSIIKQHLGEDISEKEYFPNLFNSHLTRGVELLQEEYQYAGNYNRFLNNLLGMALDNFEEN